MQLKWLEWAKQIQAISQAGLEYSRDPYDIERFNQLRNVSIEILREYSGVETQKIKELFANEKGYATPKVAVRGVIFRDGRLLFVKERADGCWSLPGGWADIGLSPKEVVIKEVKEESGFTVKPIRLLGIFDKNKHDHPPSVYQEYIIYILCIITGGDAVVGLETSEIGFFDKANLPILSKSRNTEQQILEIFSIIEDGVIESFCD